MALKKAVFLDKDGTVIEDLPYNVAPSRVRFLPRAWAGLQRMHENGHLIAIVTNQSGVARGIFSENDLRHLADYFREQFALRRIPLAGFFYCPHLPGGRLPRYSVVCDCRKPKPGLILRACRLLGVEPAVSWYIGNEGSDIAAGKAAGCRTVLIGAAKDAAGITAEPDYIAPELAEAARYITGCGSGAGKMV